MKSLRAHNRFIQQCCRTLFIVFLNFPLLTSAAHLGKVIPAHSYAGKFDRFFIQKMNRGWTRSALVRMIGTPGFEIRQNHYHWDGLDNSYLNVDVMHDLIIHASLLTPEGELLELNKP